MSRKPNATSAAAASTQPAAPVEEEPPSDEEIAVMVEMHLAGLAESGVLLRKMRGLIASLRAHIAEQEETIRQQSAALMDSWETNIAGRKENDEQRKLIADQAAEIKSAHDKIADLEAEIDDLRIQLHHAELRTGAVPATGVRSAWDWDARPQPLAATPAAEPLPAKAVTMMLADDAGTTPASEAGTNGPRGSRRRAWDWLTAAPSRAAGPDDYSTGGPTPPQN